jgi:hypothetical protein
MLGLRINVLMLVIVKCTVVQWKSSLDDFYSNINLLLFEDIEKRLSIDYSPPLQSK